MARQAPEQKKTVERVMHEFKHGELESRTGRKVRNPRQAIAIGLREAGASNQASPKKNKQALSRTKSKERRGETGQQRKEGRTAMDRRKSPDQRHTSGRRKSASPSGGTTRAELYEQAKRRDIPGRSRMSKAELERALGR
jgi:hypothetical protein